MAPGDSVVDPKQWLLVGFAVRVLLTLTTTVRLQVLRNYPALVRTTMGPSTIRKAIECGESSRRDEGSIEL